MKLSEIKDAHRNVHNGGWVTYLPNLPGISLKVRGLPNNLAAKMTAEARMAMTDEEWEDPKVQEELTNRVIAEVVLLDWAGIVNDTAEMDKDGKFPPLPYDPEIGKAMMADPEMSLLREAVFFAASNVARLGKQNLETVAKN